MIKYNGRGPDWFYDETHKLIVVIMLVVFGVGAWGTLALLWWADLL